jgi:hypothetical protein
LRTCTPVPPHRRGRAGSRQPCDARALPGADLMGELRDGPPGCPSALGVCSAGRCGGCFGRERQDRRV